MHVILPFLLALVVAIVLLKMWATKLKVAYPILLVLVGLLISFIPGLPMIKIDPDIIFFIFLPPLLNEAAWVVSFKEMKKWWRIITSFAFLVVFFTALSVAIISNYYIPGISIALGFLLGGIVSPPDAVSVGAITKFVTVPKSISTILEGESLLNDASSLIIFRFALVAIGTGQFIWQQAATSFLWIVIGGVGVGLLLGWIFLQAHKRLPTDAPSDIVLTIITPYFMYWSAEQLHCSGVLAVVFGGLYMSSKRLIFLNSTSRIRGYSVWESFVFVLNGLVFMLIGLELPEVVEGLRTNGIPLSTAIGYGVLITGVVIVTRIISSYIAMVATFIFRPSMASRSFSLKKKFLIPLIMGWTGMRGVVSLAAALSIPVVLDNGKAFPERNLILFITFVVILLTLVVQGLTLPAIITRWQPFENFVNEEDGNRTRLQIKQGLRQHIYDFLKNKYDGEVNPHTEMETFIKLWEERAKTQDDSGMGEKSKSILIELLDIQRNYLIELNKDPKINEGIIREQLYQLDLEEERIKMI